MQPLKDSDATEFTLAARKTNVLETVMKHTAADSTSGNSCADVILMFFCQPDDNAAPIQKSRKAMRAFTLAVKLSGVWRVSLSASCMHALALT